MFSCDDMSDHASWNEVFQYWDTKLSCESDQIIKDPTAIHTSPKEVHIDFAHFSRWHRVTDPNLGSCHVCQMVLGVVCKRPHLEIPYGSHALLKFWHPGLLRVTLKTIWKNWNDPRQSWLAKTKLASAHVRLWQWRLAFTFFRWHYGCMLYS